MMDERRDRTHRNRIRCALTCLAVVGLWATVLHGAEAAWPGQKDLMIVKAKGGQFGVEWDNLKLRNAMVFVTGPGFQPKTPVPINQCRLELGTEKPSTKDLKVDLVIPLKNNPTSIEYLADFLSESRLLVVSPDGTEVTIAAKADDSNVRRNLLYVAGASEMPEPALICSIQVSALVKLRKGPYSLTWVSGAVQSEPLNLTIL